MRWQTNELTALFPMRLVGPVKIVSLEGTELLPIPLATLETPLWPSTHRGARLCTQAGGIKISIIDERMTRSVIVEADSVWQVQAVANDLAKHFPIFQQIVREQSRFAQLIDVNYQIVGCLLYIRFEFLTGDASGHNMATLAAERLLDWLLQTYQALRYVSISGNYCCDKKVSAVNRILGRGKHVIAEVLLPAHLVKRYLKTTPEKIVSLNQKKNLIGSIIAGSLGSANAHVANILLAFYLATGQDAANIIEGSQAIVYAEVRNGDLYFSLSLANLIVGTVGNGKDLAFVQENLAKLNCLRAEVPGDNARRLSSVAAAAALCGELSLLAAQTNPGELMKTHVHLERKGKS